MFTEHLLWAGLSSTPHHPCSGKQPCGGSFYPSLGERSSWDLNPCQKDAILLYRMVSLGKARCKDPVNLFLRREVTRIQRGHPTKWGRTRDAWPIPPHNLWGIVTATVCRLVGFLGQLIHTRWTLCLPLSRADLFRAPLPLAPGCLQPMRSLAWQGEGGGAPGDPCLPVKVKGLLTWPTFSTSVRGWRWNHSHP